MFEADSGVERTVSYADGVASYLDPGSHLDLEFLTINDYTFICNPQKKVTMSNGGRIPQQKNEALVVINQIGYNTTYSIDLLKEDETVSQVETTRATQLAVNPGSWEDEDEDGGCEYAGVQEFIENDGLKYRLTVNCQPTQVTTYEDGIPYPTQVSLQRTSDEKFAKWAAIELGSPEGLAINSYAYSTINLVMDGKNIGVRVEGRVVKICTAGQNSEDQDINRVRWALSSLDVVSYQNSEDNNKKRWRVGADGSYKATAIADIEAGYSDLGFDRCTKSSAIIRAGESETIRLEVTAVDKGPKTPVYSYKSVYSANVQLLDGGVGPEKNDVYTTTFKGKEYKIKVKKVATTFAYESDASVSYTTPSSTTEGPLNVATITGDLISSINALSGWEAEGIGNVIRIVKSNGKTFNISARGGSTENAMIGIKGAVNDISKLPTVGFQDVVLKVQNSVDSEADDYYVRFETTGGIPGAGSWEETGKPGTKNIL